MPQLRSLLPALLLAAALPAQADSFPGPGACAGGRPPAMAGFDPVAGPHPGGQPPQPPFLRGVQLTPAQEDKVFDLLHGQAPELHRQARTLHQARQELHALAFSGQYDDGRAQALAEAQARAQGALALLQARTDHELYALLTPEQRRVLEAARPAASRSTGRGESAAGR